jgi:SAM-dependent methyltransferase
MSSDDLIGQLRQRELVKYDSGYFEREYWKEDLKGQQGNRGLSYDDPEHQQRFELLFREIVSRYSPQRMLDVGCGTGLLLEVALSNGIDAFGCDVSAVAHEIFCSRVVEEFRDRFKVSPITNLPFGNATFELTVCLDVLEHVIVFDVQRAVQELCRVTANRLVCSINLDNPYKFHPTILSRESWIALFENTGLVRYEAQATSRLNGAIRRFRSEYDMFEFEIARPEC